MMLLQTGTSNMELNKYINNVRQEILDARYKAFKGPSMLPHADIFSEIMEYHEKMIGKLLRPTMCVAVSDSLGGEHSEAVHLGAAIELVQAGSLVHDDIIDDDLFRRGMSTIHEKFHVKSAILFGDILFVASATSVRTLPEHHMSIGFRELMDVYGRASSGAMRENNRNPWDMKEYIDVIKLKTASLFRASARLGCIAADATEDTTTIISGWAEDIGVCFQLEDDIADIRKSIKENKPIGDVAEGKTTLPIILLKEKYPALEKQCEKYADGIKSLDEIPGLVAMMDEGIETTRKHIDTTLTKADFRLNLIPFKNGYDDLLKQYGRYAIESMRKEQ